MKIGHGTRLNIFSMLMEWWRERRQRKQEGRNPTSWTEPEQPPPATLHQPNLGPSPDTDKGVK